MFLGCGRLICVVLIVLGLVVFCIGFSVVIMFGDCLFGVRFIFCIFCRMD